MKRKTSKLSRVVLMGITLIILLVPFGLYYVIYVSSQQTYFIDRSHRALASIGGQIAKQWTKAEKSNSLTIDPLNVPIKVRPGTKDLSVVLVGVDSWIDTRVTIQIAGLKVLSRPSYVQRSLRKK